jgi:hypothetical protein
MVYPLSLALVKASFLALYHRVFPPPNINRYLFWGTSAFIAVYTIVIIFVNVSKHNDLTAYPSLLTPAGLRMPKEPVRCMESFVPKAQPTMQRRPHSLLHHGRNQHPDGHVRPNPPNPPRPKPQHQPQEKE